MSIDPHRLPELPELMIAGPGELHEDDLALLGHQVIAHYGDLWTRLHAQTVADVGRLLDASQPPYLMAGSGSVCLDAGLANLFEPGDKIVVANTGFFGVRLMQIARAQRLEVVEVPVEPGAPADPQRISDALDGAAGVATCHVDTSTGVRHPIAEIAEVALSAGAFCLVDAIASVGGETLSVDSMGIDCVVTSTQKGLEAPPGLGILALSERGRERVDTRSERPRSWYLDLHTWDWYRRNWGGWHPHPITMPVNVVLALAGSVRRILETGVEHWIARRADLAKRCREGLRSRGLEPVAQAGSEANLVVAMWAPDPAGILQYVAERGVMISGGLDPTMGRAIRVGLMGRTATEQMVDRVVNLVGEFLAGR